jgi:hypothetical protein
MLLRATYAAITILILCLVTSGLEAQEVPPPDRLPPCCAPPEILSALSTRPPAETRAELEAWINGRFRTRGADTADLDIQALTGACEAECPPSFRLALDTLRELRGVGAEIDGPPCCTGSTPVVPRGDPARRQQARRAEAMSADVDTFFADSFLRRMLDAPGDVAIWLPRDVRDIITPRLQLVRHRLAGRCPGTSCTQALATGLDIIREELERRRREEELARQNRTRQVDADARAAASQADFITTVTVAAATSAFSLIGVIVALIWGGRQSRRHSQAMEGWLGRLEHRLDSIVSRKRRRSTPHSPMKGGFVRMVRERRR